MAKGMPADSLDSQLSTCWSQMPPQEIVSVQRTASFCAKYEIIWLSTSRLQSSQNGARYRCERYESGTLLRFGRVEMAVVHRLFNLQSTPRQIDALPSECENLTNSESGENQ